MLYEYLLMDGIIKTGDFCCEYKNATYIKKTNKGGEVMIIFQIDGDKFVMVFGRTTQDIERRNGIFGRKCGC